MAFCGIPSIIHSDAGTEFKNNLVNELCQALDINHTWCPINQHSSNYSERVIRQLNDYFKVIGKIKFRTWSFYLPSFKWHTKVIFMNR